MQKEIDAENPETGISILGINEAGYGNNEAICEGRDIPWLQDTQEDDWWGTWGITYRDVVILNRDGNEEAVFNLTAHDLGNPNEYAAFKALLLNVAGHESITTTTTTIPLSSTTSTGVFPTTTTTTDCWLYINVSPLKGGTTSPAPGSIFIQGCSPRTVEAIPNPRSKFSHWEGDAQGSDNPITIEFGYEPSQEIVAVFVLAPCPTEILCGENSEQTELLRYIRNKLLSQTPEGREIITLYYQWSPTIVKAMEEDEEFKQEVKEMIAGIFPLIEKEIE